MAKKVAMALIKTSPLTIINQQRGYESTSRGERGFTLSTIRAQRGFTLFEVLVVIGIIAAVIGIGLPVFRKPENNAKQIIREMSVLSREVRHYARLKRSTYRIVIEMGAESKYWVEAASGQAKILSEEDLKKFNDLPEDQKPKSAFQKVDKPLKKEKILPKEIFFTKFETINRKEPITTGTVYIHFSPEGLVEQSALQIGNGKNLTWTLLFNPLTGHADLVDKALSLRDVKTN
jgi:general secretion pathway protein H